MFSNIVRILERYWNLFLIGTGYTLLMSAITVLFGLIFGALLALLRKNRLGIPFGKKKFYPIRFLAVAYIEIIRGTPILLQLYFFYFLLPSGADTHGFLPFRAHFVEIFSNKFCPPVCF